MQGFFDVQVKNAPGLTDDLFRKLGKEELRHLLLKLPTVQHAPWHKNLVNDHLPSWIFQHIMGGAGVGYPYDNNGVNSGGLANITLLNLDSEPTYSEDVSAYWTINNPAYNVGGTCGKRFIEDDVEPELISLTAGKEELYFRSRFLFTPSEAVSNDIRSVAYYYADNADTTGSSDRGHFGRVRLKDSGGTPIILNKTAAQVLLIQLILKLVTV